jgi:hypothetical protein
MFTKKAMKKHFTLSLIFILSMSYVSAQQWMKSLDIAQKLALVQNKMVLMVWEESTYYDYTVVVQNDRGRYLVIPNLFSDEKLSPLIWKNFVPVIVSEDEYANLFLQIKGKRTQSYIDKFNDDSIKIMDINGNILNVNNYTEGPQNITKIIENFALNTKFISDELTNYYKEKSFFSAYFLASKYLDLAMYTREDTRSKIIDLSNIYLEEAKRFAQSGKVEDKKPLLYRCELLKIQEYLILSRPKKVLRLLKKLDDEKSKEINKAFVSFLYYTALKSIGDEEEAELWKSKVSSVNLKKAEKIISLNI